MVDPFSGSISRNLTERTTAIVNILSVITGNTSQKWSPPRNHICSYLSCTVLLPSNGYIPPFFCNLLYWYAQYVTWPHPPERDKYCIVPIHTHTIVLLLETWIWIHTALDNHQIAHNYLKVISQPPMWGTCPQAPLPTSPSQHQLIVP